MTWIDKVAGLRARLGREPSLEELVTEARGYEMNTDELEAQKASFVRGMMPTGDPLFD